VLRGVRGKAPPKKLTSGGGCPGTRKMNAKVFSLDQANRVLPTIRSLYRDARSLQKEIRSRLMDWEFMHLDDDKESPTEGRVLLKRHALQSKIDRLVHKYNRRLELIEQLGGQVRDMETGTIEFYTVHEGRIVVLSWRDGEEGISYWREYKSGVDARRHLSDL